MCCLVVAGKSHRSLTNTPIASETTSGPTGTLRHIASPVGLVVYFVSACADTGVDKAKSYRIFSDVRFSSSATGRAIRSYPSAATIAQRTSSPGLRRSRDWT